MNTSKQYIRISVLIIISLLAAQSSLYGKDKFRENPKQEDPSKELVRLRNTGIAYFEMGVDLKEAQSCFEQAVALNPSNAGDEFNLGLIHRRLGKNNEAEKHFKKAVSLKPDIPNPYYMLGLIYRDEANYTEAISMLEKASQLAPTDATVYYQLALVYRPTDEQHFLQYVINSLQFDPYHTGALFQLSQYYREHNETDLANETFKEFSRLKKLSSRSRKIQQADEGDLAVPIAGPLENKMVEGSSLLISFNKVDLDAPGSVTAFDVRDINADSKADLILGMSDGSVIILDNRGNGEFEKSALKMKTLDIGLTAIFAEVFSANEGYRLFVTGKKGTAISSKDIDHGGGEWEILSDKGGTPLLFDLDQDADLDIISNSYAAPLINGGNATFTEDPALLNIPSIKSAIARSEQLIAADLGDTGGPDLVSYGKDGRRFLLKNAKGGIYKFDEKTLKRIDGLQWMMRDDLDNDGMIDIVSGTVQDIFVDYNKGKYDFEMIKTGSISSKKGNTRGIVADFDNDGLKDVLVFKEGDKPVYWRNTGGRNFLKTVLEGRESEALVSVLAYDIDHDGRVDAIGLDKNGRISIWFNRSQSTGKWLKMTLQGIRSVPSGMMTRVEMRKGKSYSRYESDGREIHIGLGNEDYIEILRIVWPNGFVENKFKIDAGDSLNFKESERIAGSCPSIYSWNGQRFEFITDAFISGPMGVPEKRGEYFPVDHDEYIKIPGKQLVDKDGKLQLRLTEDLLDTVYLDQVKLLAVNHPEGMEIYPNERLAPPPFPEFNIHTTGHKHARLSAADHNGNDVSDLIKEIDGKYPSNFKRSIYDGLSETQSITLTLPEGVVQSTDLRIFLTGWFYYFNSTSMIAVSQRPDLQILWPEIQAYQDGKWETIALIGLPNGKDKTVVVDISGKLKPDTTKIRIISNVEMYWDHIFIDSTSPSNDYTLEPVKLVRARVRFRGFPSLKKEHELKPERFDYYDLRYLALWNPMPGKYTRYGDIAELVEAVDSKMVVFGPGDDVMFEFDATSIPPLPEGWERDFLLYIDGYVKDGNYYTAYSDSVEPLPFAGMKTYPYSADEKTPFQDRAFQEYQKKYQTRDPLIFTGADLTDKKKGAGPKK